LFQNQGSFQEFYKQNFKKIVFYFWGSKYNL